MKWKVAYIVPYTDGLWPLGSASRFEAQARLISGFLRRCFGEACQGGCSTGFRKTALRVLHFRLKPLLLQSNLEQIS